MTRRGLSQQDGGRSRLEGSAAVCVVLLLAVVASGLPAAAVAEQASEPAGRAAGGLDAGELHSCAVLAAGSVRCWGYGGGGQLGYGSLDTIGDDETPGSVGPVNLGAGHTARAIATGDSHTCALLDDGSVRCWGFGGQGRLGYGNTKDVSDPGSVGPVDLGGRRAKAITAGAGHTCAIVDDGSVVCWGFGGSGRLGYADQSNVGDRQTPASAGSVDLGGRRAVAISAGQDHTCAILDNGNVRCWGRAEEGALGNGSTDAIGDNETPGSVPAVSLGAGHTAVAISAGGRHTCVVLDDQTVRCWGDGNRGELGVGTNTNNVGDTPATTPDKLAPVDLGAGRTAKAISAGAFDSCAVLDDGTVRCWGFGGSGRLGYASTANVGDDETPGSVGPVDLGPGRSALAISAGRDHTCARLDDQAVRCWGSGANGRLGYCNESNVGDTQTPGSVGPVSLTPGDGGATCASTPSPPPGGGPGAAPGARGGVAPGGGAHRAAPRRPPAHAVDARHLEALRAGGLRRCLAKAARGPRRHRSRTGKDCLKRYGRIPGRVTGVDARARSSTAVVLSFAAAGSDGPHPPPAHGYLIKGGLYLNQVGPVRPRDFWVKREATSGSRSGYPTVGCVLALFPTAGPGRPLRELVGALPELDGYPSLIKQSPRPIRSARDFASAQTLCHATCRFAVSVIRARITLTITHLHPHRTYYYAIAARDNVSGRPGPRTPTAQVRTR